MMRGTTCLSVAFAAGVLGGFANALAVWAFGAVGITGALGIEMAPEIETQLLYRQMIWGGIWGGLFILPFMRLSIWIRGALYSLLPSLAALILVLPARGAGMWGLGLGALTPLFVLFVNAIWGVVAAWWMVEAAESRGLCPTEQP